MMPSPTGVTAAGGAVLALTLAGVGFGERLSTTLGNAEAGERYRQFIDAIECGCVLLIVETRDKHLETGGTRRTGSSPVPPLRVSRARRYGYFGYLIRRISVWVRIISPCPRRGVV